MRWATLGAGVLLIAAAFGAATRVADTREGLVYEVVTLMSGLAGVSLFLYGLVATLGRARPAVGSPQVKAATGEPVHTASELLTGVVGLVVAAALIAGIAATAGALWALLGSVLLLPMVAGCAYLCLTFARAPRRVWKIDLRKLVSHR